jgi:hypothetical protein
MKRDKSLAGKAREVDRTSWPKGAWDAEPDRLDWKTEAGYSAIALRHWLGNWCGYVGAPVGHPAWKSKGSFRANRTAEDREITYAEECNAEIQIPGDEVLLWFGFGCSEIGDAHPRFEEGGWFVWDGQVCYWGPRVGREAGAVCGVYRDLAYVRAECEKIARELAEMVKP